MKGHASTAPEGALDYDRGAWETEIEVNPGSQGNRVTERLSGQ